MPFITMSNETEEIMNLETNVGNDMTSFNIIQFVLVSGITTNINTYKQRHQLHP